MPKHHFIIEDEFGNLFPLSDITPSPIPFERGDLLELTGHTLREEESNYNGGICRAIRIISHNQLKVAPLLSYAEFISTTNLDRRIRLRGILKDTFPDSVDTLFSFLTLSCEGDSVYLVAPHRAEDMESYRRLIGCRVEIDGICTTKGIGQRALIQRAISISGPESITFLQTADEILFNAPSIDNLAACTPREIASAGPHKAVGRVLATWHNDTALLETENNAIIEAVFSEPLLPAVGARIEVVGIPRTNLFHLNMARASWRLLVASTPEIDDVTPCSIHDLRVSQQGDPIINVTFHGQTIRLKAFVRAILNDENGHPRLLLEDNGQTIILETVLNQKIHLIAPVGSRIEVIGVCAVEAEPWSPCNELPRAKNILLVPRSHNDLIILAPPPWWTTARIWTAFSVLAFLFFLSVIWNRSLHIQVSRKTNQLLKAEISKVKYSLRLDERTTFAAELHDYHCQNLTAISYRISATQDSFAEHHYAEAARQLEIISRMLMSCRTDLRRTLWDLRNDVLNLKDFEDAIRQTLLPVAGEAELDIQFYGSRNQISDSTAHALLSILRELTANAIIHGSATRIQVEGSLQENRLEISIRDNGCGFDPDCRPNQDSGHFGLDGIHERIKRLKGKFEIRSAPGHGTHAHVLIDHTERLCHETEP